MVFSALLSQCHSALHCACLSHAKETGINCFPQPKLVFSYPFLHAIDFYIRDEKIPTSVKFIYKVAKPFHPDLLSVCLRGNQWQFLCWFMRGGRSVSPYFMMKMTIGVTLLQHILLFQQCLEEII